MRKPADTPVLSAGRNAVLSRQAAPVSQKQVRQREHHMQFGSLLSQILVSCFSIPEEPFIHRENMLDLCTNGRFLAFPAFDLTLRGRGTILALGRPAIVFIPDLFALMIAGNGKADTVSFEFVLRVSKYGERAIVDQIEKQTPKFNHHSYTGQFLPAYRANIDDFKDDFIKKRNEQLDRFQEEADRVGEDIRTFNEDELRKSGMSEEQIQKVKEAIERERQITADQRRAERDENTFSDENGDDENVNTPPEGDDDNGNDSLGGFGFGRMNGIVYTPSVGTALPEGLKASVPIPSDAVETYVTSTGRNVTLTYKTGMSVEKMAGCISCREYAFLYPCFDVVGFGIPNRMGKFVCDAVVVWTAGLARCLAACLSCAMQSDLYYNQGRDAMQNRVVP